MSLAWLTGCRVVNNESVFNFDLSKNHDISNVNWPPNQHSDTFAYDGASLLTLKLPGERVFQARLKRFLIVREGNSVSSIEVHLPDMTLDEVRRDADRLMQEWHFDDRKFAAWCDLVTKPNTYDQRFETMRNDLRPALALKVLHSFNDARPWFISFEVSW